MNSLVEYPDLMTVKEVAAYLRIKPSSVYGIKGLVKIKLGKGRGFIRIRKKDFISFINSAVEVDGGADHASLKEARHGKVGVPGLLPWKELQALHVQHKRAGVAG